MRVLGIESSCDETAAAVVDEHGRITADVVASQVALHAPYGGVVPELASRAHMTNIAQVVSEALRTLPNGLADVDGIAVTQGPGLIGALLVGLQVAKAMAFSRGIPLIGVSHLEGHLLAAYLRRGDDPEVPLEMPFVALLASGGHTAIYEVADVGDISLLGQTRDDAAGEAFDKVAKIMGLGYPGGPIVDRLAAKGDPNRITLPTPMLGKKNLEFSFSGLKTAVAQYVRQHGVPQDEQTIADMCASFQRVVVTALVGKSIAACEARRIPRLVLTGGVAANKGLRAHAKVECEKHGVQLHVPPFASCTDNAAMIAYAGARRLARGERSDLDIMAFSRDPGVRRGKILQV